MLHNIIREPKGGISLPATGYIQVHAYTSYAQLPLQNVAITITAEDGTAIAQRITDRSGRIDPIPIPVPDLSAGQTPDTGQIPYTNVRIIARLKGYEQIDADRIQVFPETITDQNLEFVPPSELPELWDKTQDFDTPPQNL